MKKMKKTINGLLLAMAVCSGSAYGRFRLLPVRDLADDKNIRKVMADLMDNIAGPLSTLEAANGKLKPIYHNNVSFGHLDAVLQYLGLDQSSWQQLPQPKKAAIKMAQGMLNLLDQKIKEPKESSVASQVKQTNRRG